MWASPGPRGNDDGQGTGRTRKGGPSEPSHCLPVQSPLKGRGEGSRGQEYFQGDGEGAAHILFRLKAQQGARPRMRPVHRGALGWMPDPPDSSNKTRNLHSYVKPSKF